MTKTYFFSGKCKWARLNIPDEKYKRYKINVYLDEASKKKFAESGSMLEWRRDEDGEFITFGRPESKLMRGEIVKFGPPEIVDSNGVALEEYVGNGSDVTVKVSIYDYTFGKKVGKGTRLEAVRVNNLVPYVKQDKSGAPATDKVQAVPF